MFFLVLDFYRYHYDFNAFAGNKSSFQSCLPNFNSRAITSKEISLLHRFWDKINIAIDFGYTNTWLYFWKIFGPNFPRRFLIFTTRGLWTANLQCCVYKKKWRTVSATATRKISSYGCNFSLSPPKYRQSLRTYLGLVDPCLHKFLHLTSPSY